MRIALAQMAPVFLNREATIEKVVARVNEAAKGGARLVCFGETLVPAYPLWLDRTDGARFESALQKRYHARYLEQAVCIEDGDLDAIRETAETRGINVIVGVAERPRDRGGHTIFCSRVFIDQAGRIASVHRKLMPTYEERLSWGVGDGAGLVTHRVDEFTVGALNCWENWLPLARSALHAAGEDLHVAIWPGAERLTRDSTRFFALEGRSFVASVSCVIREQDLPRDLPERDRIARPGEVLYNGGTCLAAPDGGWIIEPVVGEEALLFADIDHARVREERQNFDPSGHYGRPDVLRLIVDRRRQAAAEWIDDGPPPRVTRPAQVDHARVAGFRRKGKMGKMLRMHDPRQERARWPARPRRSAPARDIPDTASLRGQIRYSRTGESRPASGGLLAPVGFGGTLLHHGGFGPAAQAVPLRSGGGLK